MKFNWPEKEPGTGYGVVSAGMRKGLKELGHEISEDGMRVFHGIPYPSIHGAGILYTMFELYPAIIEWGEIMNGAKHIFTGSEWSARCLGAVTTREVHPVGHGVDVKRYPRKRDWDKFRFGCWAEHVPRKFIPQLIEAFEEEFKDDEDVELLVKTWSVNKNVSLLFRGTRRTTFVHGRVDDMGKLYSRIDSYVLPSLEGWGLTQAEAIACGIKPIVLGFGGVVDFCDNDNAILVRPTLPRKVGYDPRFEYVKPYMRWVLPEKDDLKKKLRLVKEAGGFFLDDGTVERFREKWSWKNVARNLVEVVSGDGDTGEMFTVQ